MQHIVELIFLIRSLWISPFSPDLYSDFPLLLLNTTRAPLEPPGDIHQRACIWNHWLGWCLLLRICIPLRTRVHFATCNSQGKFDDICDCIFDKITRFWPRIGVFCWRMYLPKWQIMNPQWGMNLFASLIELIFSWFKPLFLRKRETIKWTVSSWHRKMISYGDLSFHCPVSFLHFSQCGSDFDYST